MLVNHVGTNGVRR